MYRQFTLAQAGDECSKQETSFSAQRVLKRQRGLFKNSD
jgi:hypothetical protein